jgi:hypothetical protein
MPNTKLQEHSGNDKAWVWSTVDFADEEQKSELFCMRFGSVESEPPLPVLPSLALSPFLFYLCLVLHFPGLSVLYQVFVSLFHRLRDLRNRPQLSQSEIVAPCCHLGLVAVQQLEVQGATALAG